MKNLLFSFLLLFPGLCLGSDMHSEVRHRINSIRQNHGLPALSPNQKLVEAAKSQSDWMANVGRMDHLREPAKSFEEYKVCNYHPANRVINSGYFKFEELFRLKFNPDGTGVEVLPRPEAQANVGEIIAKGSGMGRDVYSPEIIVKGWMNSPGHRRAILDSNFKEFGVGITPTGKEVYWCVVFGSR